MLLWMIGSSFLLVGVLVLLPIVFETDVRVSRSLSFSYKIKLLQHVFPDIPMGKAISNWLAYRDRLPRLQVEDIGRRVRVIRELTGQDRSNHLLAVELAGSLIEGIATSGKIRVDKDNAIKPLSTRDILGRFASALDEGFEWDEGALDRDAKLRAWLLEERVDIEQVVELLLAAVEILHSRIGISHGQPD